MKRTALLLAILLSAAFLAAAAIPPETPVWTELKGPGKKNWIGEANYFIYRPSDKPKLGTIILKIQVFDQDDRRDTSFTIQGELGMPSMPGAHDSGLKTFALNKSRNYLLPLNIVMPGQWEVRLTFTQAGKVVFRGRTRFNV